MKTTCSRTKGIHPSYDADSSERQTIDSINEESCAKVLNFTVNCQYNYFGFVN